MGYDTIKLIYSNDKPLWMTADGMFYPAMEAEDGSVTGVALYVRDSGGSGDCVLLA